jgi:4-hydroxy-2-oxoglutarate aldolase
LPDECVRMRDLVGTRRLDDALTLQRRLLPIAKSVGTAYGVAALKAALDVKGYEGGLPRPPLRPAPQTVIDTVTRQLQELAAFIPEPART